MENTKRKQDVSKESKKKKSKIDSVNSLLLSITYGLNENKSKLISVGYHPKTLLPTVMFKDTNLKVYICLDHDEAIKLFFNMTEINRAAIILRNHKKSELASENYDITNNLFLRITADAVNIISHKEDWKCVTLIAKEFKTLTNLKSFIKCFVEKYAQKSKDQVAKLLSEDSDDSDADSQHSLDSYLMNKFIAEENGDSFSENSDFEYQNMYK